MSRPLLAPLDQAGATPEQAELLSRLPPQRIARLLAHAPHLAINAMQIGGSLMDDDATGTPAELREAVILRTARLRRLDYVEAQHRSFAARIGLPRTVIDAALEGSQAPDLPDDWRAALRMVEAGLAHKSAQPDDVTAIVAAYGTKAVIGLLVTAGFFSLLGLVASTLDLPADVPG